VDPGFSFGVARFLDVSEKTTLRIPSFSRISRTWPSPAAAELSASVASWEACTTLGIEALADHFEYRIQEFVFAFEGRIDAEGTKAPTLRATRATLETLQTLGGDQAQSGLGQLVPVGLRYQVFLCPSLDPVNYDSHAFHKVDRVRL